MSLRSLAILAGEKNQARKDLDSASQVQYLFGPSDLNQSLASARSEQGKKINLIYSAEIPLYFIVPHLFTNSSR